MREFGAPISESVRRELFDLAKKLFDDSEPKRLVRASEFAMEEPGDPVVVTEVDLRWSEGRLRVAVTRSDARPPFEWFIEITSDVAETDYFKHYLVRENDIVLAQRKVLTPIDDVEAEVIRGDLAAARRGSRIS